MHLSYADYRHYQYHILKLCSPIHNMFMISSEINTEEISNKAFSYFVFILPSFAS